MVLATNLHWKAALVIGLGLALSSTAVGLQLLGERKELASEYGRLGFAIEDPLPVPAICTLVAQHGDVPPAEMWEVFNMGCGFVAVVPDERADDAIALLGAFHPGTARIGTVTDEGGAVTVPPVQLPQRSGTWGSFAGSAS